MKIKNLLTEVEENQRVSFTAKKSVVNEIELYQKYVEKVGGVRLKRQEIIGLMIRKFLDDERDFKRWKKEMEGGDRQATKKAKSSPSSKQEANTSDTAKPTGKQDNQEAASASVDAEQNPVASNPVEQQERNEAQSDHSDAPNEKSEREDDDRQGTQKQNGDANAFTADEVKASGGRVEDNEPVIG